MSRAHQAQTRLWNYAQAQTRLWSQHIDRPMLIVSSRRFVCAYSRPATINISEVLYNIFLILQLTCSVKNGMSPIVYSSTISAVQSSPIQYSTLHYTTHVQCIVDRGLACVSSLP